MKIAYILFNGITTLDFIGIYDPISRMKLYHFLPELEWDICANHESIKDNFGLEIKVNKVSPNLANYDMIIIPGGFGTRDLQSDAQFITWLKTAQNVPYKVSICTGSLLLGAAGFLKGKKATTHFHDYDALKEYCGEVLTNRIVDDKNVITAGAVASSLDLGLYICQKLVGIEKTEAIRKSMDYHPSTFESIVI